MTYIITFGLIGMFFLGIPIAMSLGLSGLVAFFVEQGSRMNVPMITQRMQYGINNFVLLAVPLFILSARLMNTAGITTRLFNFATTMVGLLPGVWGTRTAWRASSSPECPGQPSPMPRDSARWNSRP
jgi:TRAP-type mannitol/chloroaromatic compound transport system permease large subunit